MSSISKPGAGGGAFEDTDGDGVAELQDDHATFQGGDARNVGGFTHGADVVDDLGTKEISPDVTDVGAAVNTAISEFGADGGHIKLPYLPSGGPLDTAIDLSAGVNGQQQDTPIVITGHGNPGFDQRGGTLLDATNLADHAIKFENGARENIHLRDFAIQNVDATADGVHFGASTTDWHRNSTIRNVGVFGSGRWGINSWGGYGSAIRDCYVGDGVGRAYQLVNGNALTTSNLIARFCGSESAVVYIEDATQADLGLFYIESNPGAAIELASSGAGAATPGDSAEVMLYLEGNNRSGNAANELIISGGQHWEVNAHWGAATNAFTGARARFTGGRYCRFEAWSGNRVDVTDSGVGEHVYERCFLGTLDTTGATNGSTYMENNISTANRNAGATVVSGD